MALSDPIGDMLTRIRNAQMRNRNSVTTPASTLRGRVLDVLKSEGFIRGYSETKFENGTAVPSNICGGTVTKGLGPISEVAFNALHNRLGIAMSNSQTFTESRRPQGTNNLFVAWETLTHANNPA